jgi:hypothetical protein
MLSAITRRPPQGASLSSADRFYPCQVRIIARGSWAYHDNEAMNGKVAGHDHHRGEFNNIRCYHFEHQAQADELAEFVLDRRLHRLTPNSTYGASREEVALEWGRIDAERDEALGWGRTTAMIMEVVQAYRFERMRGSYSSTAHLRAAKLIEKIYPTIRDPLNYAGVMIVWAERELRNWFWRCCRDHHVL